MGKPPRWRSAHAQPDRLATTSKLKVLVFAASLRADSLNRKLVAVAARMAERERRDGRPRLDARLRRPCVRRRPRGDAGDSGRARRELQRRLTGERRLHRVVTRVQRVDGRRGQEPDRLDLAVPPAAVRRTPRAAPLGIALAGRRQPGTLGASSAPRAPRLANLSRHVLAGDGSQGVRRRRPGGRRAPRARFESTVRAFLSLAEAAKHYACIKRAWVEFLGEPPGEAADRVDAVPTPAD